jgi:hypothetical protein
MVKPFKHRASFMGLKTVVLSPMPTARRPLALAIGIVVMLAAGCARQPPLPAAVPPRPAAHVQPPDWFHQQLAAARAAKRDHRPKADTAGAQQAYDEIMHTACTRAALMGPGKYPARCDAVLHQTPAQSPTDLCEDHLDDPVRQTECSD